jgi:hypothetical protein
MKTGGVSCIEVENQDRDEEDGGDGYGGFGRGRPCRSGGKGGLGRRTGIGGSFHILISGRDQGLDDENIIYDHIE